MWLALGSVYVIWGSTYLAIRVVVESLPPLGSAGVRFLLAGSVMAAAIALRDGSALRITRPQLAGAAVVGVSLLFFGNGFVQLGERDVPSGLAALIIGSVPLLIVVYRYIAGERMHRLVLVGVLVGFAGVALLVLPRGISGEVAPLGLLFVLIAAASWSWGTFIAPRIQMPRGALASTAVQQVIAGTALLAAAVLTRERFEPEAWSSRSLLALGYLVVFGSFVGFSAYTWLVAHVPVATVSTYAYVNPVVAVLLGALILDERITPSIVAGAGLIVASVAFIVRKQTARSPERPAS